jgi:hypothetical protein
MKTITLDDEAYALLEMWKSSENESFSRVVKRVVPMPGTFGAFSNFVDRLGTDSLTGNDVLERWVNSSIAAKHEPWI